MLSLHIFWGCFQSQRELTLTLARFPGAECVRVIIWHFPEWLKSSSLIPLSSQWCDPVFKHTQPIHTTTEEAWPRGSFWWTSCKFLKCSKNQTVVIIPSSTRSLWKCDLCHTHLWRQLKPVHTHIHSVFCSGSAKSLFDGSSWGHIHGRTFSCANTKAFCLV